MSEPLDAWGDIAQRYAKSTEDRTREAAKLLVEMADKVSAFDAPGVNVFEIGCGTGSLTRAFKASHPDVPLLFADFSEGMVGHVKKIAEQSNWRNYETAVLDINDLSLLESSSFSHTMTTFVLMLVPTPDHAVRELYRVTKPNGVVAIANWAQKRFVWYPAWEVACRKLDPNYVMPDLMDPYWCDAESMKKGLGEAGFKDVRVEVREYPWKENDVGEFEKFIWEGGNPIIEKSLLGPWKEAGGNRDEVRPHLLEALRQQGKEVEGGYEVTVKVAFLTARK